MKILWIVLLIAPLFLASSAAFGGNYPTGQTAYMTAIHETETLHGLPAGLLLNLIRHESNFDPSIVSNKGAVGIAQIVPKWHPGVDPSDPYQSIAYAGRYLSTLKQKFGTWSRAIIAYNWGMGNMQRHGRSDAPREPLLLLSRVVDGLL